MFQVLLTIYYCSIIAVANEVSLKWWNLLFTRLKALTPESHKPKIPPLQTTVDFDPLRHPILRLSFGLCYVLDIFNGIQIGDLPEK